VRHTVVKNLAYSLCLMVLWARGAAFIHGAAQPGCCRTGSQTVYYRTLGSHLHYRDEARIIRIGVTDGHLSLTISTPLLRGSYYDNEAIFVTPNSGTNWKREFRAWGMPSNLPNGGSLVEAASDANVIYKAVQDVGLYLRSDDRGNSWTLPKYSIDGLSREDFASRVSGKISYHVTFDIRGIHPKQPLTVYAGLEVVPWSPRIYSKEQFQPKHVSGLYVSRDGAETWSKFTDAVCGDCAFAIDASDPGLMYGQGPQGIVKSTDGGNRWVRVGAGDPLYSPPGILFDHQHIPKDPASPGGINVIQFAIDPGKSNTVYIVSDKGVYRTEDGGKTWCLLNLGFDVLHAYNSVVVNPLNSKELLVGTAFGIYRSEDRGCHFKRVYPGAAEQDPLRPAARSVGDNGL
jgi:hypothetical protein